MGFPDELYERMFGEGSKAQLALTSPSPYEQATILSIEEEICFELGIMFREWGELTWAERKMRIYSRVLKNEKEKFAIKKAEQEAERQRRFKEDLPKVVDDRPGIRRY